MAKTNFQVNIPEKYQMLASVSERNPLVRFWLKSHSVLYMDMMFVTAATIRKAIAKTAKSPPKPINVHFIGFDKSFSTVKACNQRDVKIKVTTRIGNNDAIVLNA